MKIIQRYIGCDTFTLLEHDYVHVKMEVDNQPYIWVCSQRVLQRKFISIVIILFHNNRNERLERKIDKNIQN